MIVTLLQGGMGNQMFQYALARRLADDCKSEVALDLTFLKDRSHRKDVALRDYDLDLFRIRAKVLDDTQAKNLVGMPHRRWIPITLAEKIFRWRQRHRDDPLVLYREKGFPFDQELVRVRHSLYLIGYWQTPKYFAPIEEDIRKDFTLRLEPPDTIREQAARIANCNSLCINARRTDYVSQQATNEFHGVCGMEYFHTALNIVAEKIGKPEIFVTSDDISWCKENMAFPFPTTFLDHEWAGPRFGHYLYLMSHCRHFIIPNSTFAWWAAWLSSNPKKVVVAPRAWFRNPAIDTTDLIPPDWIRV